MLTSDVQDATGMTVFPLSTEECKQSPAIACPGEEGGVSPTVSGKAMVGGDPHPPRKKKYRREQGPVERVSSSESEEEQEKVERREI